MIGQSLGAVHAASENAQNNRGKMEGMQGETKKETSLGADESKNFQTRREEMQKRDAEGIKHGEGCASQNGSAWSTEKKFLRRYKGTFDVFFGVEHRVRKRRNGGAVQQRSQTSLEICTERSSAKGCVRLVAASAMGGLRTEYWSYKTVRTTEMPKYFGHTRRRKECVLISALKILANQQKDGHSPVG